MRFKKNCLLCHGDPEDAPVELISEFGGQRSFGKEAGEISSAISIRIPLKTAYARADQISLRVSLAMISLMVAAWIIQSLFLRRLVILPLHRMRNTAGDIAAEDGHLEGGIPFRLNESEEFYDLATAFNRMSSQIKVHQDDLEDKVQQRTEELEHACLELKSSQTQLVHREKMASIGQLAAGVAHEINNPIGFVSSNLGSLEKFIAKLIEFQKRQDEFINLLPDESQQILAGIRKKEKIDILFEDLPELINESREGTERVRDIVKNLKSFSRLDDTEQTFADINECLESTLNVIWNEIKYKAKVHKDYGDLPRINCYPQQLNQVFMNLIVNAAHAIVENGEISIRTWTEDEHLCISIRDNGSGIDDEIKERLFEPFFTTKSAGEGTGLGLSISREIIEKHNGRIEVESQSGQGTVFILRLPFELGVQDV